MPPLERCPRFKGLTASITFYIYIHTGLDSSTVMQGRMQTTANGSAKTNQFLLKELGH